MQTCQVCGKTNADAEFYSRVNTYCKEHWRARVKEKRKDNIEQFRAYEKSRANLPHRVVARNEYSKTEAGKVAHARATVRFVENYPLKRAAHNAVNNALRGGRISKMPCEVCGITESIHGHHDDYAKPLNVRWLCAAHHRQWHSENGEGLNTTPPGSM